MPVLPHRHHQLRHVLQHLGFFVTSPCSSLTVTVTKSVAWHITSACTIPCCCLVFGPYRHKLSLSARSQRNLCACLGEQGEAYVLFITILLSARTPARTPAVMSTAEMGSQQWLGASDSQQVCRPCSTPIWHPNHCQALCSGLVLGAHPCLGCYTTAAASVEEGRGSLAFRRLLRHRHQRYCDHSLPCSAVQPHGCLTAAACHCSCRLATATVALVHCACTSIVWSYTTL